MNTLFEGPKIVTIKKHKSMITNTFFVLDRSYTTGWIISAVVFILLIAVIIIFIKKLETKMKIIIGKYVVRALCRYMFTESLNEVFPPNYVNIIVTLKIWFMTT